MNVHVLKVAALPHTAFDSSKIFHTVARAITNLLPLFEIRMP